MSTPTLLYHNAASIGGMADYAHVQASALADLGLRVAFLCPRDWPDHGSAGYTPLRLLPPTRDTIRVPRWQSRARMVRRILAAQAALESVIERERPGHVLLANYHEYLAPLWAGKLRAWASRGVVFGAVVHDPVRDYIVGPRWWHRRSVAAGYSYLREAFVHDTITLDTVEPMPRLRTTVIPHGPFPFPDPAKSRATQRAEWKVPDDAAVLLAFGYVRDGKNIDLAVRALQRFPNAYLVVAGTEASSGQKPARFYQELARTLGVADRCRWIVRFLTGTEVGEFFTAADIALMTYSARFRSASGVLNAAVHFRRPCLASSGQGNLCSMVQQYGLGAWVPPDDPDAVVAGLREVLGTRPQPRWDDYERDNSWERNASLVCERLFSVEFKK